MSYSVPYSFIPGTKARAQEINANFNTLTNYIDTIDSGKADKDLSNLSSSGIAVIRNNSSVRNLGELIFSPIPLTDSGLHLLDGSVISKEGIYNDFVTYIKGLYNSDNSANFFTTEALWQSSVSTYGVCAKFVYNSTNETVRLPKVTGIIENTTDVSEVGDLVQAGLPNITGSYAATHYAGSGTGSGAFSAESYASDGFENGGWRFYRTNYSFSAANSNSIYGNSSTVQPQTVKYLAYIVVATLAKTDIMVDIDEISTDLNGKADVDLSNISASQSAKNEIISWGMPDYENGIQTTLSTAGQEYSYTCPSTGVIVAINFLSAGDTTGYVRVNDVSVAFNDNYSSSTYNGTFSAEFIVDAGDIVKAKNAYGTAYLRFCPMKGAS